MTALMLIAVLSINSATTYRSQKDFLTRHHTTIGAVCQKYKAVQCVIKKEVAGTVDELGYVVETNTVKWSLYGKRK